MNKRDNFQNVETRMLDVEGLRAYTGLGRDNAKALADKAGAKVKIGSRALYDKQKLDIYLNQLSTAQN